MQRVAHRRVANLVGQMGDAVRLRQRDRGAGLADGKVARQGMQCVAERGRAGEQLAKDAGGRLGLKGGHLQPQLLAAALLCGMAEHARESQQRLLLILVRDRVRRPGRQRAAARHRAAQQVVKHPGGQAGGFTADGAYQ